MIIFIFSISYTVQLVVQHCNGYQFIDLPHGHETYNRPKKKLEYRSQIMYEPYPRIKGIKSYFRSHRLQNERPGNMKNFKTSQMSRREYEDEKDATIKEKIATLLQQTVSETSVKMKDVDEIKETYKDLKDYRAGFVISLIKKSREVLNELFNVAVRHRDEWMGLEQLKIFELIVHTNVDITNFLKQLVDIEEGRDTFEIPPSFKKPVDKENLEDSPPDPNNPSNPNNPPGSNTPSNPNNPPGSNTPSNPNNPPGSNTPSNPNNPPGSNIPSDPNKPSNPNNANDNTVSEDLRIIRSITTPADLKTPPNPNTAPVPNAPADPNTAPVPNAPADPNTAPVPNAPADLNTPP